MERKFILGHHNIQTILSIKTKIEKRGIYLARAEKIKNKQGELTYTNPESSNFWSVSLLWPEKEF